LGTGESMEEVVKRLIDLNKTISTMESCTGGSVVNSITNVEGASEILKFSAVTYSNEFKIKMGVSSEVIDKYSVYSMETAIEMSKNISLFTNSDYGVGITGKLNRIDKANLYGEDNVIYVSIYIKEKNDYCNFSLKATKPNRRENKELIVKEIENKLLSII
jgi:PncC family amidohydrolase